MIRFCLNKFSDTSLPLLSLPVCLPVSVCAHYVHAYVCACLCEYMCVSIYLSMDKYISIFPHFQLFIFWSCPLNKNVFTLLLQSVYLQYYIF